MHRLFTRMRWQSRVYKSNTCAEFHLAWHRRSTCELGVNRVISHRQVGSQVTASTLKAFSIWVLAIICMDAAAAPTSGTQPSQSQLVFEQSILTRAIGIEAPDKLVGLLDTMPLGVVPRDAESSKTRSALWSLFFGGSLSALARALSPQPFIVFYNPIADIAVIQGCKVDPVTRIMLCTQACAMPAEVLSGESTGVNPRWLASSSPTEALQRIAGARMRAFTLANPESSPETSFWRRTYCSVENQSAAENRLISLAMSSGSFDVKGFRKGAGHYIAQALSKAAAQHGGAPKGTADEVIRVLEHLNEMKMSGAIAGSKGSWMIFLTEKKDGSHLAVFNISTSPAGALQIESAHLLSVAMQEH